MTENMPLVAIKRISTTITAIISDYPAGKDLDSDSSLINTIVSFYTETTKGRERLSRVYNFNYDYFVNYRILEGEVRLLVDIFLYKEKLGGN